MSEQPSGSKDEEPDDGGQGVSAKPPGKVRLISREGKDDQAEPKAAAKDGQNSICWRCREQQSGWKDEQSDDRGQGVWRSPESEQPSGWKDEESDDGWQGGWRWPEQPSGWKKAKNIGKV